MCEEVELPLKKLCSSIQVYVIIRLAFSGCNGIGFLNTLNLAANIPKVFSTTTRPEDNLVLNLRSADPMLC